MKLLVVGGAGFLGSNFVRFVRQQRQDWEVKVIDVLAYPDNIRNLDGLDDKKFVFIQGDIGNQAMMDKEVAACDVVINFADESRDPKILQSTWPQVYTNLLGAYYLLEAANKYRKRLHHVSTDKVFGDLPIDRPEIRFNENTPYRPYTPYSATKAGADQLIRAWAWSQDVQATISIASSCFGPYQRVDKFMPRQITNLLSGQLPQLYGSGENIRDWLYVDDHSAAVLAIIEKGRVGETYLIGANVQKSNKEVVELILESMGRSINEYLPVNDKQPHDQRRAIDIMKISNELGWQPAYVDFGAALNLTIQWYQQNTPWWQSQKQMVENQIRQIRSN